MTTVPDLNSFTVSQASGVNGVANTYTFTVSSPIPQINTDKLVFTFPAVVTGPSSPTCAASTNVLTVTCTAPSAN